MKNNTKYATVGQLREALEKLPQDMPLMTTTHYDNDVGISCEVSLSTGWVMHCQGPIYHGPFELSDLEDDEKASAVQIALVEGSPD